MKEFIIKCLVVTFCCLIVCACAKPIKVEITHKITDQIKIEHETPSYGIKIRHN